MFDPDKRPHRVRRDRPPFREKADLILRRAGVLSVPDRALISAVYEGQQTVVDLARLSGEDPRVLGRRLRRVAKRVVSPEFGLVMQHRDAWAVTRRLVATRCFIDGCSIRAAARDAGITFYAARRHHDAVLAMVEASARVITLTKAVAAAKPGAPC